MKYLRWVGLMSSLVIAGVLGGLMAPLPSEALTVKIDGSQVQITTTSAACTAGYNLCSFITPGRYSDWTVGNVDDGTNKARIMIGDNSAANSLDLLKMTGITFTPFAPVSGVTQTAIVEISHTYNAGGGNPKGDYSWSYGMAGHFDPPSGENVVNDRLQQLGVGVFAGQNVTLGLGLDTGKLATPTTNNFNGSVSRTRAATVVRANCDTGSARCAPTITQTFTITVVGADKLVLTDSFVAAGATCRPVDQVIPIAPHLYALMLKLDPNAPNDINQLSAWLARMGEKYLNNPKQKKLLAYLIVELDKWLAKTVPGTCPEIQEELNAVIAADVDVELVRCEATVNCEPAESAPPVFYERIDSPGISWEDARAAAELLGPGWHLATITSGDEQAFINTLLPNHNSFPAEPAQQYWIGGRQDSEAVEPGGSWRWIDGDEGDYFWDNGSVGEKYQNWGTAIPPGLQPDDAGGLHQQNHLSLDHRYGWGWDDNDQFLVGYILGYVAEGPCQRPCGD
jgi:hypothetical protein